jgi:hypothetical protein
LEPTLLQSEPTLLQSGPTLLQSEPILLQGGPTLLHDEALVVLVKELLYSSYIPTEARVKHTILK